MNIRYPCVHISVCMCDK